MPSGAATDNPTAPDGMCSWTGVPGATASVGAVDVPISSPVRFANRIGKATWSGRSDCRGSNARTALLMPSRVPEYNRGAPRGPGMTARARRSYVAASDKSAQ